MKFVYWFFLFVASVVLVACGGQQDVRPASTVERLAPQPDWITRSPQDDRYFYAVGYAEGIDALTKLRDQALADAKAKVANTIFEQVDVDKEIRTHGTLSEDSRESLKTEFSQRVRARSAARLTGVEIAQSHHEEVDEDGLRYTRVWVQAKIRRAAMDSERNRILSELARKLALVDENLRAAESAVKAGRIREAIAAYQKAIVSAVQVEERRDEIAVYAQAVTSLLANLRIRPVSSPQVIDVDKGGRVVFEVVYLGDRERPVEGMAVAFTLRGNTGQLTRSALSGERGRVTSDIQNLRNSVAENRLTAVVDMDFPELLSLGETYKPLYTQLRDAVSRSQATVTFRSASAQRQQQTTAVLCVVQEQGRWRTLKALETEMESGILRRGYRVKRVTRRPENAALVDLEPPVFALFRDQGIARVVIVSVVPSEVNFNETVGRYIGVYQVSLQMVDVRTREVLQTENTRITASAQNETQVLQAFVNAAARQLVPLLE